MRSISCGSSSTCSALMCFGACGGWSEGKSKLRSTRSCGPEWRWIFMRTADVGTLNSVSPTLTGRRSGAAVGSTPQVGHSR
ncbi:MAG: methylenetetrahydrofolate reductase C-terminal domain-containing protein [Bradyrhizobium sp.]|nr:methylenetetrahydrofolate reductase C-terminal domain-containing protein [Bradyrhizobium sp.]